MGDQEWCCDAAAARATKRLMLADGFQVGVVNLDTIIKDVAALQLKAGDAIERELLERVKKFNYVAPRAGSEYREALLLEYGRHCASRAFSAQQARSDTPTRS